MKKGRKRTSTSALKNGMSECVLEDERTKPASAHQQTCSQALASRVSVSMPARMREGARAYGHAFKQCVCARGRD
eukprot:1965074-Pleurochrysis_carterae.AAC.1